MPSEDVPPEILRPLRAICLRLPDAYEEAAWTGTRWCVRSRTFAHAAVLPDESAGYPGGHPARLMVGDPAAELVVMSFRAPSPEFEVLIAAGPPFYRAGWGHDVMGMVLDDATDWDEVAEVLTESYCVLAPKKLVARVDRPEHSG